MLGTNFEALTFNIHLIAPILQYSLFTNVLVIILQHLHLVGSTYSLYINVFSPHLIM